MHFPKLAALVRKERAEQGISLRTLAEMTKQFTPDKKALSHQQILRVEQGICSLESAMLVLKALEVPKLTRARVVSKEVFQLAMAS